MSLRRSQGPGKWHREQEKLIESMGFVWTFLRPTMLMVNTLEWWGATIKSQSAVYFPGGKGKVPPVDPYDVAAVASTVLLNPGEHDGQIYELTGPEALTIGEMETLGALRRNEYAYVTDAVERVGLVKPRTFEKWCCDHADAFR